MTAHASDALSHENLQRASAAIVDGDSATPNRGDGHRRQHLVFASRIRSARICMGGMSGANRAGALLFNITWTQLLASDDDFGHQ